LLLLTVVVGRTLPAQATLTPPKMLQVNCESVKPGMAMAHDQHEERWARAAEAVKGAPATLAVQSATGPAATCWLTSASSYEQIGKINDAMMADAAYAKALPALMSQDAQYVSDTRSYIAVLRPDLTGGEMPNVLTRRAVMWGEWRIRAGQEEAFAAAAKAYRAAIERAGVKPDFRIYQVMQGTPNPTFWVFTSRASMAGFDQDMADDMKIGSAFTADDKKLFDDFFAKAVIGVSSNLYNYVSAQSSLTAEQRATDAFWKRRVAMNH
jgi:hypothetical protein